MEKCEFTIELKVSENEIKQICKELGGRALTEENLDKYSRTGRRILERVGEQIAQKEKKMGLHDGFVGKLKEEIRAESANGYKGLVKVYDRGFEKRFELFIFDFRGHEVLHSYAGNVKTKEELQETLDTFPEFLRALRAGGKND